MPMKEDLVSLNLLCFGIGLTKMKDYAALVLLPHACKRVSKDHTDFLLREQSQEDK
jgi:hypothetical protein